MNFVLSFFLRCCVHFPFRSFIAYKCLRIRLSQLTELIVLIVLYYRTHFAFDGHKKKSHSIPLSSMNFRFSCFSARTFFSSVLYLALIGFLPYQITLWGCLFPRFIAYIFHSLHIPFIAFHFLLHCVQRQYEAKTKTAEGKKRTKSPFEKWPCWRN